MRRSRRSSRGRSKWASWPTSPCSRRDIMTIPEDEILSTDVVYTIVGGKVVFQQ